MKKQNTDRQMNELWNCLWANSGRLLGTKPIFDSPSSPYQVEGMVKLCLTDWLDDEWRHTFGTERE